MELKVVEYLSHLNSGENRATYYWAIRPKGTGNWNHLKLSGEGRAVSQVIISLLISCRLQFLLLTRSLPSDTWDIYYCTWGKLCLTQLHLIEVIATINTVWTSPHTISYIYFCHLPSSISKYSAIQQHQLHSSPQATGDYFHIISHSLPLSVMTWVSIFCKSITVI